MSTFKMGTKNEAYVTTTSGMSGYFAVLVWWNDEDGHGFWEPWNTGSYRGNDRAKAVQEAKAWAEAEGLQYKP